MKCTIYIGRDRGDFILRHVKGTILDVGCGELHPWALTMFRIKPTMACDLEEHEINLGWFKGKVSEVCPFTKIQTIHSLPFSDNSYDTVIVSEVLEHVVNPKLALRECMRIARYRTVGTVPKGWHESPYPQYTYFDELTLLDLLAPYPFRWEEIETPYWRGYGFLVRK